jgi:uncharacterized membrane protein YfcA
LVGALVSGSVDGSVLELLFVVLAVVAAIMMIFPTREPETDAEAMLLHFNRPAAIACAATVGLLGGAVGQGGSFLLIPLMLHVLRVPTRVALGSNLAIVVIASLAGFIGKASTGQIEPILAFFVALGALPGAQLGSALSKHVRPRKLRLALAILIAAAATNIAIDVLARG